MAKEYNRSDEARRLYRIVGRHSSHGRNTIDISCPFCSTVSRAFVWSLSGSGKVCENKDCGAKHTNWGDSIPVVGKEVQ